MLTLEQLRVLSAIAEHRSIAGAARSLHLSQPTLSHHLAALESIVQAQLVVRTPRGSTLTELGEVAVARARLILDQVAATQRELAQHREYGTTLVEVAAFPSAGAALVAPALPSLAALGIPHRLAIGETGEIEQLMRDQRVHIGLVETEPGLPPRLSDGWHAEPLLDDPFLVLLPPSHPRASDQPVDLSELANEVWLSGPDESDPRHQLLSRALHELGVEPRVGLRIDDFSVIEALVLAGQGVSLMPSLGRHQLGDEIKAVLLADSRFRRRIFLAWRPQPVRPAVEVLVRAIRDCARALPAPLLPLGSAPSMPPTVAP